MSAGVILNLLGGGMGPAPGADTAFGLVVQELPATRAPPIGQSVGLAVGDPTLATLMDRSFWLASGRDLVIVRNSNLSQAEVTISVQPNRLGRTQVPVLDYSVPGGKTLVLGRVGKEGWEEISSRRIYMRSSHTGVFGCVLQLAASDTVP